MCEAVKQNDEVRELKAALRELVEASNSITGTIRNERKNVQYLRLAQAIADVVKLAGGEGSGA